MTDKEILSRIDHTLLKAAARWEYVKPAHDKFAELTIGTVFPWATITGFGSAGAALEGMGLFKAYIGSAVKIQSRWRYQDLGRYD
jgi:deoxyribose-phosphate aldolase